MLRAMVFIDFENFEINKNNYYKSIATDKNHVNYPKLDYNAIPREIVKELSQEHILVKTFLFAPKPDDFLMQITPTRRFFKINPCYFSRNIV